MKKIAMIPARMGSQRLKQKNLMPLRGVPLLAHAIRKCRTVPEFDEIWVNSEHETFGEIAYREGVAFHRRPEYLANNVATSEEFIREFMEAHDCDYLFQVHSIAPLLQAKEVSEFVQGMLSGDCDTYLCYVPEQIECAIGGEPINFAFDRKTNSQELAPIQRITWSITGWRSKCYLESVRRGDTATYSGKIGFHPISRLGGHIIKTAEDLAIAEALFSIGK